MCMLAMEIEAVLAWVLHMLIPEQLEYGLIFGCCVTGDGTDELQPEFTTAKVVSRYIYRRAEHVKLRHSVTVFDIQN